MTRTDNRNPQVYKISRGDKDKGEDLDFKRHLARRIEFTSVKSTVIL